MPPLASQLRRELEKAVIAARDKAEEAALSALKKWAVDAAESFTHFTPEQRKFRSRLRARGKQAGDERKADRTQSLDCLAQELAYESWHRMLFARFLAENHLLMHPDGVAVSLEDCEELAKSEGAANGFALAARYASRMLPQIFRADDVLLEVEFAPEHRLALERILAALPRETFLADDSLGWVYQFWQSKRKDEVNKSGEKIDGRTLPAVTQLFTEDYMVQFLLHNTIGAWWWAKWQRHPAADSGSPAADSESGRAEDSGRMPLPHLFPYLRWREDGSPAAGRFEGWPKSFKDFKMLDPCCGSGHFLGSGFNLLVPLRMREDGLSAREACDAVLRENLFGLELDPRCTQIAAFALAMAAWKFPGEDGQPLGYRELPPLHVACSGIGPQSTREQWIDLAVAAASSRWTGAENTRNQRQDAAATLGASSTAHFRELVTNGMINLHALFSDAPTLGSLINPHHLPGDFIAADYETIRPYLIAAMKAESADDDAHERAVAAAGMVKAAEILADRYTLVATNVPYLGRGKQDAKLKEHLESFYAEGKADLATAFVMRCLDLCESGSGQSGSGILPLSSKAANSESAAGSRSHYGTTALVTPQNWLFLTTYTKLRQMLLKQRTWNLVARLGPGAFETIGGHVVNVALLALSAGKPKPSAEMAGIDVAAAKQPDEKSMLLRGQSGSAQSGSGFQPLSSEPAAGCRSHLGELPGTRGGIPEALAELPGSLGEAPGRRGELPHPLGEAPGTPGEVPEALGELPESLGEAPERLGEVPQSLAEPSKSPEDADPDASNASTYAETTPSTPAEAPKGEITVVLQAEQLKNPDARITPEGGGRLQLLEAFARAFQGIASGDYPQMGLCFWEVGEISPSWSFQQSTVETAEDFGGRQHCLLWEGGKGRLSRSSQARVQGLEALKRDGIAVSQMSNLPVARYLGTLFDNNTSALVPHESANLPAIWCFCSSPQYVIAVRRIDQKLNVTNASLVKVPFDLAHWQKVAAEKYPNGLPEPESDDPTQWLFHGWPGGKVAAASSRCLEGQNQRQDAAATFGFLDREADIFNLKGDLPHWRQPGVTYFVTFRTDDSIPREKLNLWQEERAQFLKANPEPWDEKTRKDYSERFPARLQEWLDAGHGACLLARPGCKKIVEEALRHFDGERYKLDEFVVMPNHVHALVTPMEGHALSEILHSWKSFTANQINKAAGRTGTFWQKESFDHILRNPGQLEKVRQYIRDNPKKVAAASSRCLGGSEEVKNQRQDAAATNQSQDGSATFALQVAVARLLGYRWPAEQDEAMRLSDRARALVKRCGELLKFADKDGIVCIPGVRSEPPAAERLTELLRAAYGKDWTGATLNALITATGCKAGTTLDDWLRNSFFEQHCKLFHNRPFVWHVWDGRKDGFSALINYHKLDHKTLENLTHSHLQDWINAQNAAAKAGATGADLRLKDAQALQERLKLILEGAVKLRNPEEKDFAKREVEYAYDIFVRWKPLHEQAIGWNPDLNDGVRMNIRPFMEAEVLRKNPNVKWTKDRGKEPERDKKDYPWFWNDKGFTGERVNDVHLTNAEKQAARERVKKK